MRILAGFILVLLSALSFADGFETRIIQFGAATDQYAVFKTESSAPTKPDCASDYVVFSFDKTTAHGQDLYAIALTAIVSQSVVKIWYSTDTCGLWGSRTIITRIDLYK